MSGSNIIKQLRKIPSILAITFAALALSACGKGDGPTPIQGTAATPLPVLPAGFCDPINFELLCEAPAIVNFNGGATEIVDNPDASGINTTERVARMQKFGDQVFGGTRLNILEAPLDFGPGEAFTVKVWSERAVPLTFKLEETTDGTLGVERVATHTGGSEWQELCFDFTGGTVNTIAFTLIFDNGVLGAAVAGVFSGDWTFYYDEITQVQSCSGGAGGGTSITPEVTLYDPAGSPDLEEGVDYTAISPIDSGSVINTMFADDTVFSPVIQVSSGTDLGANVAKAGFIGFDAGFLTAYEDLIFKVKGMPNNILFVTLQDSSGSARINLVSNSFSSDLGDGWFQVSVPLSTIGGLTTATGVVFESDDTAAAQFAMLLTDIGFTDAPMGGGGGTGGGGDPRGPSLGVFSETTTDPVVNITNIAQAGNPVTIDSMSTAVTPFDGTVSLGLTFSDNTGGQGFGGAIFEFDDADVSAFDTLRFAIDTSVFANFANLTVQIEPPGGGTPGGNVSLASYTPVSTSGNWDVYEIPLADFTAVNLAAVNRLGFFNARNGSDVLLNGILWIDDIIFTDTSGSSGGGTGGGGSSGGATIGVFSETTTDPVVNITNIAQAGNPVTIDSMSTAVTPFDGTVSLGLTYSDNTNGNGFGGAIFEFDDEDLSAFDTLRFAIDTSMFANFANLTVQLEPPGGGTPGGNVSLAAYTPVSTTGNWDVYEIPLADFTAVTLTTVNRLGFFNARDGSDTLLNGALWIDDITFTDNSGSGGGGSGGGGSGGGGSGGGGGSSVLVNGDFEASGGSLDGWTQGVFDDVGGGLGSITADSSGQGGRGGTVARLIVDATSSSFNDAVISQEGLAAGTVTAGDTITVTFDMYGTVMQPGAAVFAEVIFLDGSGMDVGGRNFLNGDPTPLSPTTTWTTVSGTVTAGTGFVPNPMGGPYDVSGGLVLSLKVSCGPFDDCAQDVSFDNVTFTIN